MRRYMPQVDATMEMALINLGENTTNVSPKDHPLWERLQIQGKSNEPHRLGKLGSWTGVDVWTGKAKAYALEPMRKKQAKIHRGSR